MGFASSLFGGSNPTLNSQLPKLGSIAGDTSSQGVSDVSDASNFFHSILSGNASKVLAPQISSIQKQGQQKIQSLSQFGNRGGGTNAAMQTTGDTTRSSINDFIASLTGSAAGGIASLGSSLISQGLGAYAQQADVSQTQMQNWQNSILGSGITSGISALESYGLGKLPH